MVDGFLVSHELIQNSFYVIFWFYNFRLSLDLKEMKTKVIELENRNDKLNTEMKHVKERKEQDISK